MTDIVLNRASLVPLYAPGSLTMRSHVEDLLRGIAYVDEPILRTHSDLWIVMLEEGALNQEPRSFAAVVNEFYEDPLLHDVAEFFTSLQRMTPSDSELDDNTIDNILNCAIGGPAAGLEFTFDAATAAVEDAIHCGTTDSILASLDRDGRWSFDRVGFTERNTGGVLCFDHISRPEHGEAVSRRRTHDIRLSLSAQNFAEIKEICFPHLRFGQDVDAQIFAFSAKLIGLAFKRLDWLNSLSEAIGRGKHPSAREKTEMGIKLETYATMKNYGSERVFRDNAGSNQTFEEHIWVDKLYRIHFYIHNTAPIIEVGYMGRHLSTMEYPT